MIVISSPAHKHYQVICFSVVLSVEWHFSIFKDLLSQIIYLADKKLPAIQNKGHYTMRFKLEHEQIDYISSKRCMKQLMDWLSNPH